MEVVDPLGAHYTTPLRTSITPTKKVDVDRTIMPDGTIVTTVTTIQSRPRPGKLGTVGLGELAYGGAGEWTVANHNDI